MINAVHSLLVVSIHTQSRSILAGTATLSFKHTPVHALVAGSETAQRPVTLWLFIEECTCIKGFWIFISRPLDVGERNTRRWKQDAHPMIQLSCKASSRSHRNPENNHPSPFFLWVKDTPAMRIIMISFLLLFRNREKGFCITWRENAYRKRRYAYYCYYFCYSRNAKSGLALLGDIAAVSELFLFWSLLYLNWKSRVWSLQQRLPFVVC